MSSFWTLIGSVTLFPTPITLYHSRHGIGVVGGFRGLTSTGSIIPLPAGTSGPFWVVYDLLGRFVWVWFGRDIELRV